MFHKRLELTEHITQHANGKHLLKRSFSLIASQNGTYHRAWSPTIAELHALVLSHLQKNFNYCIIRKQRFFLNYLCSTRDTYPHMCTGLSLKRASAVLYRTIFPTKKKKKKNLKHGIPVSMKGLITINRIRLVNLAILHYFLVKIKMTRSLKKKRSFWRSTIFLTTSHLVVLLIL